MTKAEVAVVSSPAPWVERMKAANIMLAEAAGDPQRASRVWNHAEAARVYAIQLGLGVDAINHAVSVKLKSQRLLADAVDAGQAKGEIATKQTTLKRGPDVPASDNGVKTFDDLGIARQRVSDSRKIRDAFTDDDIDAAAREASEAGEELSSSEMLLRARVVAKRDKQTHDESATRVTSPDEVEVTEFPCIVIDPPWRYDNKATRGAAEDHYPTMSLDELAALEMPATENAHLYLWVTNGFLREAFDLLDAWGFTYKACLTWCKPQIGMGNYFRNSTEHVYFAIKGSLPTEANNVPTWFLADRTRHSAKPELFYDLVEKSSPGPHLEMFARRRRFGWHTWGNEA